MQSGRTLPVLEVSAASVFKVQIVKMEVADSSETLVTFHHTVWHHILEHRNLHGQQCKNLTFCSDIATNLYKV
jgi:hypothetical protein